MLKDGCADMVILVTPSPAPFSVMALLRFTLFKPHVQFPDGTFTVCPAVAVLMAFCTSVEEQESALT